MASPSSHRPRHRRRKRIAFAILTGILLVPFVLPACRSLPKERIEERLAALPKNAHVGEVRSLEFRFAPREGDEARASRLSFVRLPAREPTSEPAAPIVCVHPTPSSLFSFAEAAGGTATDGQLFAGLARRRDVYLIDVVGHGFTRTTLKRYDFGTCARWVAAAIEALGLREVVLIGNSYGGEFCWRAALDRPDLVSQLVLVDCSGYAREAGDFLPEERAMRSLPGATLGWLLNSRDRVRSALAPHFRTLDEQRLTEVHATLENADNWKAMVHLVRDEEGRRAAELPALRVPTLLVWGANDLAYPVERYAARFAADIPDSRLVVIPECGHYPQEERPALFVAAVEEFLAE